MTGRSLPLATPPLLLAGLAPLLRGGLYRIVPGIVLCYLVAAGNACIVLIEI